MRYLREAVLLVEGEAVVRKLIREMLAGFGFTVLEAGTASDALRKAEQCDGAIHLLLTDIVMPEMAGPELAEQLIRKHPELKVLYMSGYSPSGPPKLPGLKASAPLVEKPFTPDVLIRRVREVLSS